ncbi:tRNA 2-thiouridine(34) synthase MnmA [Mycoplasmopsis lipophila]|uniref:tRNA 2-thiouridine(34) synthase MnmA n=1 Tax=Mycoplasmopsis lipophila TaxID=2117 RepID=UPI0038731E60
MKKKNKVILGMSGGVDSSVCAYLLLKQGYEVEGLFMRNWDSFANNDVLGNKSIQDDQCPQEKDYQDALKVANQLNIKLHRVDFVKEYWNDVFKNFIEEYKKGRTPNPDILCNKYIKFKAFANYAFEKLDADFIAMGHYAKVENGKLYRAKDQGKDQTYFLSQLTTEQLSKVIMPLAELEKLEVRNIAKKLNLETANKKDSTGICFIGERNFTEFLKNYIPMQEGNIVSIIDKTVLGKHQGCFYYTIGQRKGLNLGGMNEPHYVCGHNVKQNILYVAPISHMEYLDSDSLIASNFNFNNQDYDENNLTAKFRYRQKDIKVKIKFLSNSELMISYPKKSQSVTPGQQVVLYDGQKCLGGGIIEKVFLNQKEKDFI